MATRKLAARRIGSAVTAGLGQWWQTFLRKGRRRRVREQSPDLGRQLAVLTDELRKANLIQYHRLITDQWDRSIDDPSLGVALSTLSGISDHKRRQMLFVNRVYQTVLLGYRVSALTGEELHGHLRMLARNEVFAEYWERTAEHRLSLPLDSWERRIGMSVDVLVEELAEDPDEWWVVGRSSDAPID